jgi:hypothetical protein
MTKDELKAYLDTLSFDERLQLTTELAANLTSQMLLASDILEEKSEPLMLPKYEQAARAEIERIRRM